MVPEKRKSVDLLIEEFWRKGYLTIRRKFGTYLPEPNNIGGFEVDVVARQRKSYAIGITLTSEDFNNPHLAEKISYLSTRQTKFTNRKVLLFVGVPEENLSEARELIKNLPEAAAINIKLIPIVERKALPAARREVRTLFS